MTRDRSRQPPVTLSTYRVTHAQRPTAPSGAGAAAWETHGSCRCVYSKQDNIFSTMSGFDSNPFVDPVDVNPFQVGLSFCFLCVNRVF